MKFISAFILILLPVSSSAYFRGNLNLNYQERESEISGTRISSFGQVLNINAYDKFLYGNDFSLGAYLFRTKNSNQNYAEFRVRYSMNLSGPRYALYSSLSPYKIRAAGQPQINVRQFQISATYQPIMLPNITSSYSSTRQKSSGDLIAVNSFNYTWNVATSVAKSFGAFRASYQRQKARPNVDSPARQLLQSIALAYDISRQWPARIVWSTSYSFTGSRNQDTNNLNNDTKTHNVAGQLGRSFGKWFNTSFSATFRNSDFQRQGNDSNIRDYSFNFSNTLNLRRNIAFGLIRGYSVNQIRDDSTIAEKNDYLNFSGDYKFLMRHEYDGRFSVSRSIYFESIYGRVHTDNGSLIFDVDLYRQTMASINLGIARNSYDFSGQGRIQSNKGISIQSRPLDQMNFNFNYQSSITSRNANFLNINNENITITLSHLPKPYFNYSLTYNRSSALKTSQKTVSSLTVAANARLSRSISALATYSRRDVGIISGFSAASVEESATTRLSWIITRNSNLTINYGISSINTPDESTEFGGYYSLSF